MFHLTEDQYYQVQDWARWDWLRHGFGTRHAQSPLEALATMTQIHGSEVRIVNEPGLQGTGDGLISDTPGLLVGVKTADCLPILLVDPQHRVVAAVHAGWRGTAAAIVAHAVELMRQKFDSQPDRMEAAIGPGIGSCCFEVGPEVAREFGPWYSNEKTCLNLSQINRDQLRELGVAKVHESGLCTMCGPGFYSFRRERDQSGRMLSFAGRI